MLNSQDLKQDREAGRWGYCFIGPSNQGALPRSASKQEPDNGN